MSPASGPFPPGHSAQILAFPVRDRGARTAREQRFATMEALARGYAADSNGWYHEEAIAEERDSKH